MSVTSLSVLLRTHPQCQGALLPGKNASFVITHNVFLINKVAFCWQRGSILSSHARGIHAGSCLCMLSPGAKEKSPVINCSA